jgi:hypothetical protein
VSGGSAPRAAARAALAAVLGAVVAATAAAAVVTAVALAAAPRGGTAAAARAAEDPVRLTVTFTRGAGPRRVAYLRCTATRSRADGFLRDAGAGRACTHARRITELLSTDPDPNRACTEIYGGPERARVSGRIGARRIARGFSRTDGCQIADWRTAMPLLPRPR